MLKIKLLLAKRFCLSLSWDASLFFFFCNLRTWQEVTSLFLPYWKVGFILYCRIVTSTREPHLQMLLCSSRTDEAAPWGVWLLISIKRGWGIWAFPSAAVTALDPVPSSLFAEESWHPVPFPAWYSWIWHHFPIAHGKEKERAMTLSFWLSFTVVLMFGQWGQYPCSYFSLCFLEQAVSLETGLCSVWAQCVLPEDPWRTEDPGDKLAWHWLHWLNACKVMSAGMKVPLGWLEKVQPKLALAFS